MAGAVAAGAANAALAYLVNRTNILESEAQEQVRGSQNHHLQIVLAKAFDIALSETAPYALADDRWCFEAWHALL
jgi:hypothetical protein